MDLVATLLIVGVVLLLLETILPGMIAGILGAGCLIGAVVVAYSRFGPGVGHWVLLGTVVGLVVITGLWLKYFPQSRMARKFISENTIGTVGAERPDLLHETGTAFTPLRPSGTALINGERVDVVTEGGFIERGTPIEVVAIEGMRVVVRSV